MQQQEVPAIGRRQTGSGNITKVRMVPADRLGKTARTERDQQASQGYVTGQQAGRAPQHSRSGRTHQQTSRNSQASVSSPTEQQSGRVPLNTRSGLPFQQNVGTTEGRENLAVRGPQMPRSGFPQQTAASDAGREGSSAPDQQISQSALSQRTAASDRGRANSPARVQLAFGSVISYGGSATPTASRGARRKLAAESERKRANKTRLFRRQGHWEQANIPRDAPVSAEEGQCIDLSCSLPREEMPEQERKTSWNCRRKEGIISYVVWMETRLLIAPKIPAFPGVSGENFIELLISRYNEQVAAPNGWPEMKDPRYLMGSCCWQLRQVSDDPSATPSGQRCEPVPEFMYVELESPMFTVDEHESSSNDRSRDWKAVFQATWTFLNKHYIVQEDSQRRSNIETEVGVIRNDPKRPYTVSEIKRLCAAIIHFEPVLSSFADPTPLKRNSRDNPRYSASKMSRTKCIAAIEAIKSNPELSRREQIEPIRRLMHPSDGHDYCWALDGVSYGDIIEYRLSQPSTTAGDAIWWVDMVLSFVRGAQECKDIARLQRIPASIHGLRYFISGKPSNPLGGI